MRQVKKRGGEPMRHWRLRRLSWHAMLSRWQLTSSRLPPFKPKSKPWRRRQGPLLCSLPLCSCALVSVKSVLAGLESRGVKITRQCQVFLFLTSQGCHVLLSCGVWTAFLNLDLTIGLSCSCTAQPKPCTRQQGPFLHADVSLAPVLCLL